MFASEVQFGHAGACANAERETADAKNKVSTLITCRKSNSLYHYSVLFCLGSFGSWSTRTWQFWHPRYPHWVGRHLLQTQIIFWHDFASLPGMCMSSWWLLDWLFLNLRRSPRLCRWTTLGPRSLVLSASHPPSCPVSVMRGERSYCTLACLSQMYSR